MKTSSLVIVLGWSHVNSWLSYQVKFRKFSVLIEGDTIVFKREVREEKGEYVGIQVFSQLEQELILQGLKQN